MFNAEGRVYTLRMTHVSVETNVVKRKALDRNNIVHCDFFDAEILALDYRENSLIVLLPDC